MSKVCFHHECYPVRIYDECVACEIESLRREIEKQKQEYDRLRAKYDIAVYALCSINANEEQLRKLKLLGEIAKETLKRIDRVNGLEGSHEAVN